MVCVRRLLQFAWGLPHIFIVLQNCCYHKLQKPTSSSSDQSETSTALHVSSVSGLLSAPAGHTVVAQRCFRSLLWDLFLFIADSLPWPVKAVGDRCGQGTRCLCYWPRQGFLLRADMAFPYANGCSNTADDDREPRQRVRAAAKAPLSRGAAGADCNAHPSLSAPCPVG